MFTPAFQCSSKAKGDFLEARVQLPNFTIGVQLKKYSKSCCHQPTTTTQQLAVLQRWHLDQLIKPWFSLWVATCWSMGSLIWVHSALVKFTYTLMPYGSICCLIALRTSVIRLLLAFQPMSNSTDFIHLPSVGFCITNGVSSRLAISAILAQQALKPLSPTTSIGVSFLICCSLFKSYRTITISYIHAVLNQ